MRRAQAETELQEVGEGCLSHDDGLRLVSCSLVSSCPLLEIMRRKGLRVSSVNEYALLQRKRRDGVVRKFTREEGLDRGDEDDLKKR